MKFLTGILDIFKKEKTSKEIDRELNRNIRRAKVQSAKLTKEININFSLLKKQIKTLSTNSLSSVIDMEIKRTSKKIILLQKRRSRHDNRIERIEKIRDTIADTQIYSDIDITDVNYLLENQISIMESSKKEVCGLEDQKLRVEVLREEMEDDIITENEVEELAENLVSQTMTEILD